jgi:hypothetical protein
MSRLARRHVVAEHQRAAALPRLAQRRAGGSRPGQQRRHAGVIVAAVHVIFKASGGNRL